MNVNPSVSLPDLITIPEAAKRTPLSEGQLRGWIDRKYIRAIRFGGRIYLEPDELKRVLKSDYHEPEAA